MGDKSSIEWTDATWNPIVGCSIVSKGCTNCYAMRLAGTRLARTEKYGGLTIDTKAGPVWNGHVREWQKALADPLRWGKPRKIFVNSEGDLFHEQIPDEWIDRVFAVMALCPEHTFQVLTKRPDRMRAYLSTLSTSAVRDRANGLPAQWQLRLAAANPPATLPITANDVDRRLGACAKFDYDQPTPSWPLPNVWLGVSTEDQATADERIPLLLETPAAIRFVSAEPLLGPIDFRWLAEPDDNRDGVIDALRGRNWIQPFGEGDEAFHPVRPGHADRVVVRHFVGEQRARLDWIIVGGESGGPNARPMHPAWARSIRDQCQTAGTAFFFKQWGEWGPDDGPPPDAPDRIMEGRVACAWWDGSAWHHERSGYQADIERGRGEWVYRLGKKAAGRLLDGREWSEFPREAA